MVPGWVSARILVLARRADKGLTLFRQRVSGGAAVVVPLPPARHKSHARATS